MEEVLKFVVSLQADKHLNSLDEAAVSQGIILQLLALLGWNIYNVRGEVHPEYPVGERKKVDFALRTGNKERVFIEVKKHGEDLENHQQQLLDYSFRHGVKIAILTNGMTWWFYLPLHEGSWEQRRFHQIDIYAHDAQEIAQTFVNFISKPNTISGEAVKNAENIYRRNSILATLPKAWNTTIRDPGLQGLIADELADATEGLCGYKPGREEVEAFVLAHLSPITLPLADSETLGGSELSTQKKRRRGKYRGHFILAFTFDGNRYEVQHWSEMLVKVCEVLAIAHGEQFKEIFNLKGRKRIYFSKNPDEIHNPRRINGTDIYVETNFSADSTIRLVKEVLSCFGYAEDSLSFETQEKAEKT